MTHPILNAHRFLTAAMAVVALLGWGVYAYSVHSSATRDEDRLEALARTTTDRNRLLSEQQQLVVVQQSLQGELALANAQLAAAREEIASLKLQQKGGQVTVEPVRAESKAAQQRASEARARSDLTKLIGSQR
jgi:hypothetical protein